MSVAASNFMASMPALSRASSSDSVDSAPPRTPPAVDSQPRIFGVDNISLPIVEDGKSSESQQPTQNITALHPPRKTQSPEDSEREFLAEFQAIKERCIMRPPPPRSVFFKLLAGIYNLLFILWNIKDYAIQAVAVAQLAFYGATVVFKMRRGTYKPATTLSGWLFEAFCSLLAVFIGRFAVLMTKLGLICVLVAWIYRVYFS
ncbi:hypothetical protein EXIGLDRAFT_709067 [Exidia glandulosa HHB12029]|uniref:Uncharacterized protein n=1 Tax=Exidia glandulosa HHB12029 TaxID=1314781 RepID=A0A166MZB4_EXIGL|nr:hypothetical protein EXIGLDRAFT_709067 [Exidia glandulosa HHB12029]